MLKKFDDISFVHGLLVEVQKVFEEEDQSDRLYTYPRRRALTNLAKMQKRLSEDNYVDKLEKVVIYYLEGALAMNIVIANYLYKGVPSWDGIQVRNFKDKTCQNKLERVVSSQLKFLRHSCGGCPYHHLHKHIANMKMMKDAGQVDYLEEIEYSFVFYSIHLDLNQIILSEFLPENYLAGVASLLGATKVLNAVGSRMKMITAVSAGITNLGVDVDKDGDLRFLSEEELYQKTQAKKNWRDFWGSEFDQINKRL